MASARTVAIWLGLLSAVGLVLQALALQDISHGEADVMLEWTFVRLAYATSVAFHVFALRALLRR